MSLKIGNSVSSCGCGILLLLFPCMGQKLYSHCPSHPAVKLGSILYACQGTAEKQLMLSSLWKNQNKVVYTASSNYKFPKLNLYEKFSKLHYLALIACMVEVMPLVLLCGLFKVHSKHSNRTVTVIQQSCSYSYHKYKTKKTSVSKKK